MIESEYAAADHRSSPSPSLSPTETWDNPSKKNPDMYEWASEHTWNALSKGERRCAKQLGLHRTHFSGAKPEPEPELEHQ